MRARLRVSDLVRLALSWAISSVALIIADRLLSSFHAESDWSLVLAAAVTGLFGFLLRPLLVRVAAAIGWLAVGAFAIAGQAVIMHLALSCPPRRRGDVLLDPGGCHLDRGHGRHLPHLARHRRK